MNSGLAMSPYQWSMTIQLRYLLALYAAARHILLAYFGHPQSIALIQWLVRER
jgi:hypothetical protein